MGYGEFGGTGSVKWEVRYDGDRNPMAVDDPKKRKRRETNDANFTDVDVSASEGSSLFVVCSDATLIEQKDGKVIVRVTLQKKDGQVKLYWGADSGLAMGAASALP